MKLKASLAVIYGALYSINTPVLADTPLHAVVTASRIAQSTDETLAGVSVITEEDIKNSHADTAPELLGMFVPGLDFTSSGGKGHQTSAFLRGTSSDHVLIIIDGIAIGSATTGTAPLELLPVLQIERIEVIRGPRSSLYGSEAIGGVIQIFTKKSSETNELSLTYGSHNTSKLLARTGMNTDNTKLLLSVAQFATDGFDVTNDTEADDDGFINTSINLNASQNLQSGSNIYLRLLRANGETEFDNDTNDNVSDSVQQLTTLGYNTNFSDGWTSSFSISQSRDELDSTFFTRDFFTPSIITQSSSTFNTTRDQLHWQNDLHYGSTGQFGFGLDYINDSVESTTSYSETERDNTGLYLINQNKFDTQKLQVSVRSDDNQAFGQYSTGSLAWSIELDSGINLSASVGSGFKAPSFNELYYASPFFNGNPDLQPEKSTNRELAITSYPDWGKWDFRYFQTDISNLIVTDATFTSVENANRAEIDGFEFEYTRKLENTEIGMSLAFIDPLDTATGLVLQNRAKKTMKLNIKHTVSGYNLGVQTIAQSSRFADSANTIELPGYGIINLTLNKELTKHWSLNSRIENLLDKNYSTSIDFYGNTTNNTPFSVYVGVSYSL